MGPGLVGLTGRRSSLSALSSQPMERYLRFAIVVIAITMLCASPSLAQTGSSNTSADIGSGAGPQHPAQPTTPNSLAQPAASSAGVDIGSGAGPNHPANRTRTNKPPPSPPNTSVDEGSGAGPGSKPAAQTTH
jgi:hypothetical protein